MVKAIILGSFYVTGNKIHVSDPCCDYDSVCAAKIVNALSGKYFAKLTLYDMATWGIRVANLSIYHANHKNVVPNICTDCVIGVDNGQAGFFNDDYYAENQGGDFGDISTLFGLACSLTMSKNHGGIMQEKGVVSETGFGDGSYSLYVGKNKAGKIVSASIIFIADDELEEP